LVLVRKVHHMNAGPARLVPRRSGLVRAAESGAEPREDVRGQRAGRVEGGADPGDQRALRAAAGQPEPPRLQCADAVLGGNGATEGGDEGEHGVLVTAISGRRGPDFARAVAAAPG